MTIAGAVLCGGASRRMGTDKSLIELDGVAMAERVALTLEAAGCAPVVFVGGDRDALAATGRRFVPDGWPGEGPVGGVLSALSALREATAVVIVACDLPDLTPDAVRDVIGSGEPGHALRVADSGRLEPMLGCWPAAAHDEVAHSFHAGSRALHDVIAGLDAVRVPVAPAAVRNVNRPADLRNRQRPSIG